MEVWGNFDYCDYRGVYWESPGELESSDNFTVFKKL
jgi:hypothetical protein